MSRYPATPAELERLMAYLAPVATERRPAIARMVFEEADTCPACGEAVRRCDARALRDGHLYHVGCGGKG